MRQQTSASKAGDTYSAKRVQILVTELSRGGAGQYVQQLANLLVDSGVEVCVLHGGDSTEAESGMDSRISVKRLRRLRRKVNPIVDIMLLVEARSEISKYRPDVLSLHTTKPGLIGRLLYGWHTKDVRVLYFPHGWSFNQSRSRIARLVYRMAERMAARLSATIVAVSKDELSHACALRPSQMPARMRPAYPATPQVPKAARERSTQPILILPARFASPKLPVLAARSLALVEHPFTARFIGEGPLEPELRRAVTELGLGEKITIEPWTTDMSTVYASASALLLLSEHEGMPLSILEALRFGLPIIASAVGGIPEVVRDQVHGRLVSTDDEQEIAEILNEALEPQMLAKFSHSIRSDVSISNGRIEFVSQLLELHDVGQSSRDFNSSLLA